ncbi:DUF3375 domain-containing protein [Chitinophaga japonensis]|uniref:Uncharacterized protein DUF3375 n=1 Tax=Chitinophaga japonensis TaxID=104662 RepID=A0A562SSV7_CHIJA|nr:DUF3375 domain-containing protein [Chitinophaga japonensis]TWI84223.1 uncharacterized protein DUF3375 [Chitinophaga japonensis]
MHSEDIAYILNTHPALQMLRLQNARWVLPMLYKVFKEDNRFLVEERVLIQLVAETLASHTEGTEDLEEANILFGENEEARSRKYILNWVQKRLLQDFTDAEGVIQYQLSAYTERVFQWLTGLQHRHHVGTESRFKLLFNSLQDIVEHTEDDARKRLQMLKDKRAEIDKEIKAIELGIAPDSYNNAQVQERLELFTRLCYELIGDFREVEDNFKQIHRSIVEHHTRTEQHKGAIVGYAFEAYDALRNSSQGKSFYAFWDFLISREGQSAWKEMTEQLLALVQERGISADEAFIRDVKSMLLQQGRTVYDANDKMAEKLSRIIAEKEIARHRRLRRQISAIKEMALDLMDVQEVPCGITIEEGVEIKMVMDRKLQMAPRKAPAAVIQPVAATEQIADPERLSRALTMPFIDKKKLWDKVEQVLQKQKAASLKEILELDPPEHGLAEVVGYFRFLREKPSKVSVVGTATELIPLNADQTRFVEVPYLLFNA